MQRVPKPPHPGLISIKWKPEIRGTSKRNGKDRRNKSGRRSRGGGNGGGEREEAAPSRRPSCKLEALLGGVDGRPAKSIDFICGQRGLFLFHTNFHGQRSIKMAETRGREGGSGGDGQMTEKD